MTGKACLIDLKIAFDTLNHEILLHKLKNYGFRGKINEISRNSPQGSVLRPFRSLICNNDLPGSCEKAEVAMFADDTTLVKSGKRVDPLLSQEINCVRDWFHRINWQLTLKNVKQCVLVMGNQTQLKSN